MPIKLEASDRNALVLALTQATQVSTVSPHSGVLTKDRMWLEDLTNQLTPNIRKSFDKYLDGSGISGFVRSNFFRRLLVEGEALPRTSQKLDKYEMFSDPLSIARTVCDEIESLPWQYRVILRASSALAFRLKGKSFSIKITNQLSVVSHDQLPSDIPIENEHEALNKWIKARSSSANHPDKLDQDGAYFIYRSSGFVDERINSKIVREASDEIRAFYGACIALNLFYDDYFGFGFEPDEESSVVFIHRIDDTAELVSLEAADTDLQRAMQLDTTAEFDHRVKEGESIESILEPAVKISESEESARLNTAAVWLLRTYLSSTDIDRVLESTITMEVLLGDREASDRVGLSKLMANRCAYALGNTQEERQKIIDFFVKFYKVRSDIVHSGKFKPSEIEKGVVGRGVSLASRILRHEISICT